MTHSSANSNLYAEDKFSMSNPVIDQGYSNCEDNSSMSSVVIDQGKLKFGGQILNE